MHVAELTKATFVSDVAACNDDKKESGDVDQEAGVVHNLLLCLV